MRKKLSKVIIAALTASLLFGCGKKEEEPQMTTTENTESKEEAEEPSQEATEPEEEAKTESLEEKKTPIQTEP